MTKKAPLPHNLEAEECVLGAALLARSAVEYVVRHLEPSDFYRPAHAHIFQSIRSLYQSGQPVDAVTVANDLKQMGVDTVDGPALLGLQINTPTTDATRYGEIVKRLANARKQVELSWRFAEEIQNGVDPYEVSDRHVEALQSLERVGALPDGFTTYDTLLDAEDADAPVIIPGICYADTRVVIVATEKSGKSVLLRQVAFCSSQGVHPFTFEPIDPVRVMVLDLENPMRELRQTGHLLRHRLQKLTKYDPDNLTIFRRPAGMDMDSRHDRNELEAAIEHFRPQVIVGGPVYKMLPEGKVQDDRRAAAIVQNVLDGIRIRHSCALMLEHHAPIGQPGDRELRAIGGMMWQAWPDVSISLKAEDSFQRFMVKRPHPERGEFNWPPSFVRGPRWPWEAEWPHPLQEEF